MEYITRYIIFLEIMTNINFLRKLVKCQGQNV